MTPDPSYGEPLAVVLSVREQWRLLCWMEAHPAALAHEVATGTPPQRRTASRLPSLAYALGVAVGTVWLVLKRWW